MCYAKTLGLLVWYHYNHYKCIEQQTDPELWKLSIVTPIPKIATPIALSDFRPISILLIFAKSFELILTDQISCHINKYKLLDYLHTIRF